jgi:hypothetical protein
MNLQQIEERIHAAIDAGDERTLDAYAEHSANWLCPKLVTETCRALLTEPRRGTWSELMAIIMDRAPDLALVIFKIDAHTDKHRAEFMDCEARNVLEQNEAAQERAA